jgi:hypothetical protein
LSVNSIAGSNASYGLPNHLKWKAVGLKNNVTYTVSVADIADAPQSSYSYEFTLTTSP